MEQQTIGEESTSGSVLQQRAVGFVVALALHVLIAWALVTAVSFRLATPDEQAPVEPKIVALATQPPPPPPDVEALGAVDVVVPLPRFRPRIPKAVPGREQREFGDPALAVWKYLCNRDEALSEATRRDCPSFTMDTQLGMRAPLNSNGDVGALYGADTATMSHQEVAKKKGWLKPKTPLPADGARAKANDLGLPGHDPFEFLPKERSKIWGGQP